MMTTESQAISDLFRNPRKVQRTKPFNKVASHTYGKGSPAAQEQQPPPGQGDREPSPPRPDKYWGYR